MMSQPPLFTIVCVTVNTAARKVSQFLENDDSEKNNKQSELKRVTFGADLPPQFKAGQGSVSPACSLFCERLT